jgi:hypothetical protein
MSKGRTLSFAGALFVALAAVVAPRYGESRRAALRRLRATLRSGRGSLAAFAGTPCATAATAAADRHPDER